jgi:hypothetical protein
MSRLPMPTMWSIVSTPRNRIGDREGLPPRHDIAAIPSRERNTVSHWQNVVLFHRSQAVKEDLLRASRLCPVVMSQRVSAEDRSTTGRS